MLENICECLVGSFDRINKTIERKLMVVLMLIGLPDNEYLCYFGIDLLTPKVFDILQHNYDNNIRTKGTIILTKITR